MILYKVYLGLCLVSFTNYAQSEFRPDIPLSKIDTYRSLRISGGQSFSKQFRDWLDERRNPSRTCEDGNLPQNEIVGLSESLPEILRYKDTKSCRCIPMGETCFPGTCTCEEICPNHHGILKSRANYMRPTIENEFPFINSLDFNDSAFKRYPVNEGYCSGYNYVLNKFKILADFHPDLKSRPAMKKGSPEWRNYILAQIERIGQNENVEFYGISDLQELAQDIEFREALRTKAKWSFNDKRIEDKEFWNWMTSALDISLKFSDPTGIDFKEQIAIDPDSGSPIPPQGTPEYQEFMAEKVKKISEGYPTSLPGYSSINSISSDPTYMEIIGSQIAIDWKSFLTIVEPSDPREVVYYDPEAEGENLGTMTPIQLETFIRQTKSYLPLLPGNYPEGRKEGESWNEKGPFQVLPITISTKKEKEDKSEYGLHSINAWAYQKRPGGGIEVCINDPNYPADKIGSCYPSLIIDNPDEPSKVSYVGGGTVLKFNYDTSGFGRIGSMTSKLVEYCRRTKAFRFKGGKKCAE